MSDSGSAEVVGGVARLPFDVAADAGALVGGAGPAGPEGVDSGPDVLSGHGDAVAGAGPVHLAPVDQAAGAVEEEEVGGAGSPVGLGHLLGVVGQAGEGPAVGV